MFNSKSRNYTNPLIFILLILAIVQKAQTTGTENLSSGNTKEDFKEVDRRIENIDRQLAKLEAELSLLISKKTDILQKINAVSKLDILSAKQTAEETWQPTDITDTFVEEIPILRSQLQQVSQNIDELENEKAALMPSASECGEPPTNSHDDNLRNPNHDQELSQDNTILLNLREQHKADLNIANQEVAETTRAISKLQRSLQESIVNIKELELKLNELEMRNWVMKLAKSCYETLTRVKSEQDKIREEVRKITTELPKINREKNDLEAVLVTQKARKYGAEAAIIEIDKKLNPLKTNAQKRKHSNANGIDKIISELKIQRNQIISRMAGLEKEQLERKLRASNSNSHFDELEKLRKALLVVEIEIDRINVEIDMLRSARQKLIASNDSNLIDEVILLSEDELKHSEVPTEPDSDHPFNGESRISIKDTDAIVSNPSKSTNPSPTSRKKQYPNKHLQYIYQDGNLQHVSSPKINKHQMYRKPAHFSTENVKLNGRHFLQEVPKTYNPNQHRITGKQIVILGLSLLLVILFVAIGFIIFFNSEFKKTITKEFGKV